MTSRKHQLETQMEDWNTVALNPWSIANPELAKELTEIRSRIKLNYTYKISGAIRDDNGKLIAYYDKFEKVLLINDVLKTTMPKTSNRQ